MTNDLSAKEPAEAGVCAGLRVVDFSWGIAGPLIGMVMGDLGAEVIKIEPPGGDPFRTMPGAIQWHRGKKSVVLDLKKPAELAKAEKLIQSADVLLEGFRPGVADRLGIGYTRCRELIPSLVYCSVSGFGDRGPWRQYKGYEGVVLARGGYMAATRAKWRSPGPVYLVLHQASYGAMNFGLQGIFGALRLRELTGQGNRVETSLLQGGMAFQINRTYRWADPHLAPTPDVPPDVNDPLSNVAGYRICQCSDGQWIQLGVFQSDMFDRMMIALGLEQESTDPRYANAPQFANDEDRKYMIGRLEDVIVQKPLAHWMTVLEKHDVAYSPQSTTQEAMDDPHVRQLGLVVSVADPRAGPTEQVGPLMEMQECGWRVGEPAPAVGQDTATVLRDVPALNRGKTSTLERLPRHMLEGINVLEVATYVAAPTALGYLVDYGASVTRVEPPGGDPQTKWGDVSTRPNRGKRSVWLDLKNPQGQQILREMVKDADIFLHNFRPGVAERLGIDYGTLVQVNPSLVYCHAASYGTGGPYAGRPAFDPVISALMGGETAQAGTGNPPIVHFTSDLGAGVATATALMLALYVRQRTGRGQRMETRMLNAAAYLHSNEFLRYAGKPPRKLADKGQHGICATYRLYEATEGWVFLAIVTDKEWRAFCAAVGKSEWSTDQRFATAAARAFNDVLLITELEQLFMKRTSKFWEELLTKVDVACVEAHEEFPDLLFGDQHMSEVIGLVEGIHTEWGRFIQPGAGVRITGVPNTAWFETSASGHDTKAVLERLGFSSIDYQTMNR